MNRGEQQQYIAEDGIKNAGCCFQFPVADGLMNAWLADCSRVESKAVTWKYKGKS